MKVTAIFGIEYDLTIPDDEITVITTNDSLGWWEKGDKLVELASQYDRRIRKIYDSDKIEPLAFINHDYEENGLPEILFED